EVLQNPIDQCLFKIPLERVHENLPLIFAWGAKLLRDRGGLEHAIWRVEHIHSKTDERSQGRALLNIFNQNAGHLAPLKENVIGSLEADFGCGPSFQDGLVNSKAHQRNQNGLWRLADLKAPGGKKASA